jgi:hypothetical protein
MSFISFMFEGQEFAAMGSAYEHAFNFDELLKSSH